MGTIASGYALIDVNGEKKISKRDIHYQHSIEMPNSNYGSPITESVAKMLIANYKRNPIPRLNNSVRGVTYRKDILEIILKQSNCTGISFYLAKKHKWDFENPDDAVNEGITLVAIGQNDGGFDIATNEKENIVKHRRIRQRVEDIPVDIEPPSQNGIIFEMVPPVKLTREKLIELFSGRSFEEMIESYFNLK